MLTPIELQTKSFKSGGLGYDKKDVDHFFKEVSENYERLYSENIDLKDKVSVLNDALQQYKSIEKTLQRALVLAEKTAEDTKAAALKDARNIEKEATMKSQLLMADAKNELERIHAKTLDLLKQFDKYKAQFKSLAAAQIELLESESYSINASRLEALEAFEEAASAKISKIEAKEPARPRRTEEKHAKNGAANIAQNGAAGMREVKMAGEVKMAQDSAAGTMQDGAAHIAQNGDLMELHETDEDGDDEKSDGFHFIDI